jgi:hypothetical protein
MIDWKQSEGFVEYCRHLDRAKNGNAGVQRQLLRLGVEAQDHMDRLLADASRVPEVIERLADRFDGDEIRALRTRGALSGTTSEKIVRNIMFTAAQLFRDHPRVDRLPDWAHAPNTFIFRLALGAHLWALRWISVGGAKKVRPEKMRNDMVDIQFATYATFYDGVLTADKKVAELYKEMLALMHRISISQQQ